eukprot:3544074-Alexandrium_andersonii.AAC.1
MVPTIANAALLIANAALALRAMPTGAGGARSAAASENNDGAHECDGRVDGDDDGNGHNDDD